MAINTTNNQNQQQSSLKGYIENLSFKENKFTTDAAAVLMNLKSAIDIDTNVESVNMASFELMRIYKSLETLMGEWYLIALCKGARLLLTEGSK